MSATAQAAEIAGVTRDAVAAAVTLGRRLGLNPAEPEVLSSRGNVLVHLAPAPVVARVATLTAWSRRDPAEWLAREVAVAGYVAARGGPAVSPASVVPAGPHWQDGLAITMWDLLRLSPERPSPAGAGAELARFHRAARDCPADLGYLTPARELVSEGLEVIRREAVLDTGMIALLRQRHESVLAAIPESGPQIVLHGDAHPGNLLAAGDGWRWTDLEETCRGPVEWDLTVLARQSADGDEALRGYAAAAGSAVPDLAALEPFGRARVLEAAIWTVCMAHRYPSRYRESARSLLAAVLEG